MALKAKRFEYLFCEIASPDSSHFGIGRLTGLSLVGAYIPTLRPAPKGSVISLRFRIGMQEIHTQGEVVHSTERIGMGVRFTELSEAQKAAIAAVVPDAAGEDGEAK